MLFHVMPTSLLFDFAGEQLQVLGRKYLKRASDCPFIREALPESETTALQHLPRLPSSGTECGVHISETEPGLRLCRATV